jgi:hypothetical protein
MSPLLGLSLDVGPYPRVVPHGPWTRSGREREGVR